MKELVSLRGRGSGGQVLVLFALALALILVPAIGLGVDGSRAFEERRAAQIAVDQAAIAATRAACVPSGGDPVAKGLAAAASNSYGNTHPTGIPPSAESGNRVRVEPVDGEDLGTDPDPYRYQAIINTRISGTFSRIAGSGFRFFDVEVKAIAQGSGCGTTGGTGGPGTGPIYAGGATCPGGSSLNNIEISGGQHTVTGQTQTNGNFKNGGSGSTFNASPSPAVKYVGTFQGGSNTYLAAPQDIGPAVPTPQWPAGWGPTDMPVWTSTEPFWAAYRNHRVNTGSVTATSFNITSSGVWYTEAAGTLDVTGITAGVNIVIVAPRAAIKLPTDLSTSNLVGREFTPYNNAALPKQNVIMMTGFVPSDGKSCDGFSIEKSGESGTFKGIIWAPRAMVRWSGNEATLYGCIIAHAFQMNGNEHRLSGRSPNPSDPDYCAASSGSTNPEISLIK